MEKHRHPDESFKKILENHPQFKPSQTDLEDMRKRLDDAEKPQQKSGMVLWWVPLLLLPMLMGSGYLFFQNQKLNTELQELSIKVSNIQNDTILSHTTFIYDTIYRTTYIDNIVERNRIHTSDSNVNSWTASALNYRQDNLRAFAFNSPSLFFEDGKNLPFQFINPSNPFELNNSFTTLQRYQSFKEKNQNNASPNSLDNEVVISNDAIFIPSQFSFLVEKENANVLLENITPLFEYKKRRRNSLYHMRPKGLRIGLDVSPLGMIALTGDQAQKPMNSYGFASEIEFNERFRIGLGVRQANIKFELKDPVQIAQYPAIQPNDPTDLVREMYVILNHLQVPISFKYLLGKNKKWKPFLSAGLVASRPLRQRFEYKLISTSLEQYERDLTFKEGTFSIKNIQGSAGLEYSINKKWYADAHIFYLHDLELNPGEYFLLRNLGLNIGLKYKL